MKVYLIYFSPTGSTEKAVRALASGMGGETEVIDLKTPPPKQTFSAEDVVIWGVPSFGGRVPGVAMERFHAFSGAKTPCILLTAYGNRDYDDTLLEMKDAAEAAGFYPVAAVAAVCEHSIVREFAAGRPDAEDLEQLKQIGEKVRKAMENGQAGGKLKVKGSRPYKEKKAAAPMPIMVGEGCVNCKLCARECPVQAISYEDVTKTAENCISCMRCISVCPAKARSLPEQLISGLAEKMRPICSVRKENEWFLAEA